MYRILQITKHVISILSLLIIFRINTIKLIVIEKKFLTSSMISEGWGLLVYIHVLFSFCKMSA